MAERNAEQRLAWVSQCELLPQDFFRCLPQQTAASPPILSACVEVPEEGVLGCSPVQDSLLEHFWEMEHLSLPP